MLLFRYFGSLPFLITLLIISLTCRAQRHDYSIVYHIQLMEADSLVPQTYFAGLYSLGFIKYFGVERGPLDDSSKVRIMLGPYLGTTTADFVLQQVWKKGFPDAKLVEDDLTLIEGSGANLTHTVQVGAFRRPHFDMYEPLVSIPAHGMFIVYENGLFKVLSGLYTSQEESYLRQSVIPYYQNEFGLYGFVRKIR